MSVAGFLIPILLLHGDVIASNGVSHPLERSVLDTPGRFYVDGLKQYLLMSTKKIPTTLAEAASRIVDDAQQPIRSDIGVAARTAAAIACSKPMLDFSGRIKAAIFADTFWKKLETGKISNAIAEGNSQSDRRLLFSEFVEIYLNEYAVRWNMRYGESKLLESCKSYGVDGVTPCLEALLVFEAARTSRCPVNLPDAMYFYMAQPSPPSDSAEK